MFNYGLDHVSDITQINLITIKVMATTLSLGGTTIELVTPGRIIIGTVIIRDILQNMKRDICHMVLIINSIIGVSKSKHRFSAKQNNIVKHI